MRFITKFGFEYRRTGSTRICVHDRLGVAVIIGASLYAQRYEKSMREMGYLVFRAAIMRTQLQRTRLACVAKSLLEMRERGIL